MASKHLISRLLSGRNQLSRPEADELREAVLDQVAPRVRRRRWLLSAPALALAGAAAAILVAVPLALRAPVDEGLPGDFTPRGGSDATAALELRCESSGAASCQVGETLLFDVSGAAGYRFFSAFAQRDDGAVIWYFPESPGGEARALSDATGGILGRGILIGEDHPPGRYRVFAVFSDQPLDRGAIVERFDEAGPSAGPGTAVIERELVVQ